MEVEGKIREIFETKEYGSNGFQKREMVVTTQEQYPQHLLIEFVQDRTGLLDNFERGQMVKVGINLRGREWINPEGESVYFNSLNGWRIEALQPTKPGGETPPPADQFEPASSSDMDLDGEDEDDLPF
ncbi:MAG TPA: DUF3127 domain-containing protein [Flavobacteriaceae bacterium]|nr:DUF3127 domain-containing protein [Flavobacteriaceae bacterium]